MSGPRDELNAFERSLSGLTPGRTLDRDRLMYEAGRRAGLREVRRGWRWPAVAAALGLVTLGQAFALSRRPPVRVAERIVAIPAPSPAPAAEAIVILTRREPETPHRGWEAAPARPASLAARTSPEGLAAIDPPLLSAAYLGPLDVPSVEPLSPLHGRDGDLRSIPGGPL